MITQLEYEIVKLREEMGRKNIELAGLRVDLERGDLEYKKKCQVLQVKCWGYEFGHTEDCDKIHFPTDFLNSYF